MKSFLILFIFSFILISCFKSEIPCIPSDLQNHVIAFYPFSGGSLNDVSGNDFHLVNPNIIPSITDREGNASCAFAFDGSSRQFLSRHGKFTDDFQKANFSISLWYKPINFRTTSKYELLIGRSEKINNDTLGPLSEWGIGLYDCRVPVFNINRRSLRANRTLSDSDTLALECSDYMVECQDQWFNLIITFDKESRHLYINSRKSSREIDNFYWRSMSRNIGDLVIGKGFNGEIDDIIIFNKVLSQNEVNQLFNLAPCCL
jgi:hypothetical protein